MNDISSNNFDDLGGFQSTPNKVNNYQQYNMDSNRGYNFAQKIFQDDEFDDNNLEFNNFYDDPDYVLSP